MRRSAVFFVASCLIAMVTHDTGSADDRADLVGPRGRSRVPSSSSRPPRGALRRNADPERRGEIQGADRLGFTVGSVWAPAAYTFLAMNWGTTGWLIIAAIAVAVTERRLERRPHAGGAWRAYVPAVRAT